MTAKEMVLAVRDNVQIGINDGSLENGFADDMTVPGGTSILSVINKMYRECVMLGFLQCYKTQVLTPGTNEFRIDFSYTFIYEATITDLNDQIYTLIPISKQELNRQYIYWRNWGQARPRRYYTVGSIMGFDFTPDQAYTLTLLADVLPTDMVAETDTPSMLEDILHDSLVDMASYDIAAKAIKLQAKDMQDAAILRFKYLSGRDTQARDYIKRVANGRRTSQSRMPMVQDNYRQAGTGYGYRG